MEAAGPAAWLAFDRPANILREKNAPWNQERRGGLGLCPVSGKGRHLTSISVRYSPFPSLERFWKVSKEEERNQDRSREIKANMATLCKALSLSPSLSLPSQLRP